MRETLKTYKIVWILFIYLLPICFWIAYTYFTVPIFFSGPVAFGGLAILFLGSALLFSIIQNSDPTPVPVVALPKQEPQEVIPKEDLTAGFLDELETLKHALGMKETALQEKEAAFSSINVENQEMKQSLQELLETTSLKEQEFRVKIEGLEIELHQKAQHCQQLENQIHDLGYEIKTLLQLTEVDYSKGGGEVHGKPIVEQELIVSAPISPAQESGRSLLTRCVDMAQKMTAGYHASMRGNLSSDPYAFDLRRLADVFRQESGALIVLYSPVEERVLFASGETKALLGLSPEQFAQDFSDYAGEDFAAWKSGVLQLLTKPEVSFSIEFMTKQHDFVPMRAHLASIPTGIFRTLVVGVLQP